MHGRRLHPLLTGAAGALLFVAAGFAAAALAEHAHPPHGEPRAGVRVNADPGGGTPGSSLQGLTEGIADALERLHTSPPTSTTTTTTAAPTPPPALRDLQPPAESDAGAGGTPPDCVRQRESGGDYTVVSPDGLYHGAWQFLQSTWDATAADMGRHDLVGLPPERAPPADQDAVAAHLWNGGAGASHWGGGC